MSQEESQKKEKDPDGIDGIMEKLQQKLQGLLGEQYGVKVMMPAMQTPPPKAKKETEEESPPEIEFELLPSQLEAYLEDYVVGQPEATLALATKVCTHFHRVAWEMRHEIVDHLVGEVKANMLIIGPTGVGKTYVVRLIAEKLGVPLVKGDATKFSETGYVGGDVEQLVRDLVHQADGSVELAENGIIYLDEIDKIAGGGATHGPDVSRTGVQRNLLKLMEESEVDLRAPFDLASQMEAMIEAQRTGKVQRKKVNTRNILFMMSGAFVGLDDIIKRRLRKKLIGFEAEPETDQEDPFWLLSQVRSEDLLAYGFEPEFVGRLPIVIVFRPLDEEKLFEILKNPMSPLTQGKVRDFASYGIELEIEEEALEEIAHRASTEGTGARGLKSILEQCLLPLEHSLPGSGINRVVVTIDAVKEPQAFLAQVLVEGALVSFVTEFRERTGIRLSFTPQSRHWIVEQAIQQKMEVKRYCEQQFAGYEYGLKLAEKKSLRIGLNACKNPRSFLDSLIKKAYASKGETLQDERAAPTISPDHKEDSS